MSDFDSYKFVKALSICFDEQNLEKEYFIDASDLIYITKGIYSLDQSEPFSLGVDFNSNRCLVHSILFSGLIKPGIRILPTHRSEFIKLLNQEFSISRNSNPELLFKLLENANPELEKIGSIEQISKFPLKNWISLFKLLQLKVKVNWEERFNYLYLTNHTLKLETEDLKLNKFSGQNFNKYLKEFNKFRESNRHITSNFYDAFALTHLEELVKRFNLKKNKSLPLFYDPSGLFKKVVVSAGLESCFIAGKDKNSHHSVFRNDYYFIVQSIFTNRDETEQLNLLNPLFSQLKELTSIYSELAEYKNNGNTYDDSVFKIWDDKFSLLKDYFFILNSILPNKEKYDSVFGELKFNINTYKKEIIDNIKKITNKFEGFAPNVKLYENILKNIHTRINTLKTEISQNDSKKQFSISKDLGLIRFSFSEHAYNTIDKLFENASSDDKILSDEAIGRFLFHYLFHQSFKSLKVLESKKEEHYMILAGYLWQLNFHAELYEILNLENFPGFNLKMIKMASFIEANSRMNDSQKTLILEQILEIKKTKTKKNETPHKLIAISYLSFHLLESFNNRIFTYSKSYSNFIKKFDIEKYNILIDLCIYSAKEALKTISRSKEKYYIYCLNILIYYTTESGTVAHFDELSNSGNVEKFLSFNNNFSEKWNYIYDDTLARYYHRLSVSTTDNVDKRNIALLAIAFINRASSNSYGDRKVLSYQATLNTYLLTLSKK